MVNAGANSCPASDIRRFEHGSTGPSIREDDADGTDKIIDGEPPFRLSTDAFLSIPSRISVRPLWNAAHRVNFELAEQWASWIRLLPDD